MSKKAKASATATQRALAPAASLGWAPSLPPAPSLPWGRALTYDKLDAREASILMRNGQEITGDDILALAAKHVGEKYVFGARAPMGEADWKGPWDCAEFASWCVYRSAGILFGTEPRDDPLRADAYTGYWAQQARSAGAAVPLADALATPGALLLRYPLPGAIGHIAFSDGTGGTIEAHSTKTGVIRGKAGGRRWDVGVMIPGIRYYRGDEDIAPTPPAGVIRLTHPLIRSTRVQKAQERLLELGYATGPADGIYGPQTAHSVAQFQAANGLVADGEIGPLTWKALKLDG